MTIQFGILTPIEVNEVMSRREPTASAAAINVRTLSNEASLRGNKNARGLLTASRHTQGNGITLANVSSSAYGDRMTVPLADVAKDSMPVSMPVKKPTRIFSSSGLPIRQPATTPTVSPKTTRKSSTALNQVKKASLTTLPLMDSPPNDPIKAPAVSFSNLLTPPAVAAIPEIHAHAPPKAATSASLVPNEETDQPVPSTSKLSNSILEPTSPPSASKSAQPASKPITPTKPALKPKSWADLLRSPSGQGTKRVSIILPAETGPQSDPFLAHASTTGSHSVYDISADDRHSTANGKMKVDPMEDLLHSVELSHIAPALQPRGMINQGNMCFENSILQVLIFCAPFYNLMQLLQLHLKNDLSGKTRLLEASIALAMSYKALAQKDLLATADKGEPFLPEDIYEALKSNKRFDIMQQGQQEDAQEFLGFFLDTLHEELLITLSNHTERSNVKINGNAPALNGTDEGESDGWLEVGSKGRTSTTRKSESTASPISRIFAGLQRSHLYAPGQKDSATVEPFLTLPLDIQPSNVETIEDALANLTVPETVSDYAVQGGLKVEATKQLFLEKLPPVLILHLKRFSYNNVGGTIKNHKVVGYGVNLDISPSIISQSQRPSHPIRYHLTAVVYHHGRSATGGHYTTSILQQNGQWMNIDDTVITPIAPGDVAVNRVDEVLRLSLPSTNAYDGLPDRSAYLLFYSRSR